MKIKILNTFNWEIKDIINNLELIKNSGFTHIQICPVTPTKTNDRKWVWLYQPIDFTIGNVLGSKDDFILLCNKAHEIGLNIIVDVVLRHLAGEDTGKLLPHEICNKYIVDNKSFWLSYEAGKYCDNRDEMINKCWGMPTLNYYNEELQKVYIEYLDEVLMYADGLRVDMGKHYALPEENCTFWKNVVGRYSNKFIYSECINLNKELMDKYSNYTNILISDHDYCPSNEKSVVFFESHDTYFSWGYTKNLNDNDRLNKWNDLLNKYDKCLFFSRPFDKLIFSEEMKRINSIT